jgi:hypothetical protein
MFTIPMPDTPTLDDLLDAWVCAARDSEVAWTAWRASPAESRADAYAGYRASLDREEQAATMLATALRRHGPRSAKAARRFATRAFTERAA